MFARFLRVQIDASRIDEFSKLFEKSVIPLCKKQKGYKGAYFLADRKAGKIIPITLWESEEDMIASERNRFFQEQLVKFLDFFTTPPVRETYKVEVQD